MADPPPDTGVGPDRESTTGTPRWVKVSGIIAIVLVLLFVIMMFAGIGGSHGPGRHTPSGGPGGDTPLSSVVTEDHTPSGGDLGGHTPPKGGRG
ncbi:MAG: hypothetical protein ACRDST_23415 [Pseudonocardiaceae bacterium]